jgi:hypothetical protein
MGRTQARVVMSVLVLALLGGATGLARCPQFVSFTRAALPEAAATQGLSAGYQPVTFRASDNATGPAHETFLKATMPMDRGVHPAGQTATTHRRVVSTPALLRSRQRRMGTQQLRRYVVLSSWDESGRPILFTVNGQRVFSSSYAAVPTAGGWLLIQL